MAKDTKSWVSEQPKPESEKPTPDVALLLKENQSLKGRLLRGRGTEDVIIAAVKEVYNRPSTLVMPPPPDNVGKGGEEVAVLHISDTQIGKRTRSYDHVVAAQRLMLLAKKVVEITNMRRSTAKIKKLKVFLGGDMVEAETNFPSQPHHISIPLIDQATLQGPEMLEAIFLYFLEHFDVVEADCVVGNHGRNGQFGTPGVHEKTNWDRVLYRTLALRLLGSDDNPHKDIRKRLSFNIPDTFWAVADVLGWGQLIVHGDQIRGGYAGFPWYGASKKAWGWIDAIDLPWDYLWIGHFHTYATCVLNDRIMLANGTTESDNDYAQEQLAACGQPCQRLAFFNRRHGLIADHQVFLVDRVNQRTKALGWAK